MDDLISRQAAIDALCELYEYQRDIDPTEAADLVRQGIFLAEKKIEKLPSAQPATNCSEIPNGSDDTISRQAAIDIVVFECGKWTGLAKEISKQLKQLPPAQPENKWIPCSERLPEKGSYLVWMPFAPPEYRIAVAEHCDGHWNIKTPISAWMPLPEPYRGGEKE